MRPTFVTVDEPTTKAEREATNPRITRPFNARGVAGGAYLIWRNLDKLDRDGNLRPPTELGPQRLACMRLYAAHRAWHDGNLKATDLSRPFVDEGSHKYGSGEISRASARQDYQDARNNLTTTEWSVVRLLIEKEASFRDIARKLSSRIPDRTAQRWVSRIFYQALGKLVVLWGLGS